VLDRLAFFILSEVSFVTENVQVVQRIYEFVIQFLVGYSFQLLGAIVILIVGVVIAGWTAKALLRTQERRNVDVTLRQFIASAARLLVIGLAVVVALGNLGISITPFIAAIGGLAVGASLALQGPISNYGAGLVIILTRVFRVGDTITVQGCSGIVSDITLATTVLKAEDGEDIIIPNKQIAGEIHRNSRANRIVEGRISVAYGENVQRAVELVRAAVESFDGAETIPKPQIGVEAFGDYAIAIGYRVWLPTVRYYDLMYRLNLAIIQALEAGGIQVSAPRKLT
jgi:small conductance mechanosensitive channel